MRMHIFMQNMLDGQKLQWREVNDKNVGRIQRMFTKQWMAINGLRWQTEKTRNNTDQSELAQKVMGVIKWLQMEGN